MWISSTLPFIKRCLLSLLDRLGLPRLPSPVSLFLFLPCRVNGVLPSQPFHHSCPAARSIPGPSRPLCAQEECKGQWFGVWETELWWTMSVWSPDSVGALAWHHSLPERGSWTKALSIVCSLPVQAYNFHYPTYLETGLDLILNYLVRRSRPRLKPAAATSSLQFFMDVVPTKFFLAAFPRRFVAFNLIESSQ